MSSNDSCWNNYAVSSISLSLSLSDISVVFVTPQLLEQVPTALTSLYAGGAGVTTGISAISGTKSSISSL